MSAPAPTTPTTGDTVPTVRPIIACAIPTSELEAGVPGQEWIAEVRSPAHTGGKRLLEYSVNVRPSGTFLVCADSGDERADHDLTAELYSPIATVIYCAALEAAVLARDEAMA